MTLMRSCSGGGEGEGRASKAWSVELRRRRKVLRRGVNKSSQQGQRGTRSVFSGSQVEEILQDRGSNQLSPPLW